VRNDFIAGNWKMHKTRTEAVELAATLAGRLAGERKKIMIAPPFTALAATYDVVKGTNILLGAQNMSSEEKGAHTGEISLGMLKDAGVAVVILGHSERRHVYGENDELINRKVLRAVANGMDLILCVGETLDEREQGITTRVVEQQLRAGLQSVGAEKFEHITIAYEPVWAIGTGKTATAADADEVHSFIRTLIAGLYSTGVAEETVIQYGGSVKPANAAELMSRANIDGLLVGGASLEADSFVKIVKYQ
jgi:triosephosphate isomerase